MSEANRVKYPQFPNPPDHSCAQCACVRVCVERWECGAARVVSPTALILIRHCHSHDSSSPELATRTRDNNTHHAAQSCSATAQPCSTVISDWGMCRTHPLLLLLSSHFHFSSFFSHVASLHILRSVCALKEQATMRDGYENTLYSDPSGHISLFFPPFAPYPLPLSLSCQSPNYLI